ncbi:hypothetical protein FJZ21_04145 [Candidatus Pacearchaeota archaeon]|nr:hypothetical protein [Candidatus Pacearchaeota archaeon]
MVYKIMNTRFRVFLESAIIAMLILIIGFSFGLYVESKRNDKVIDAYKDYEVEALDLKLQNYYYQIMDSSSCERAIEQNFQFAEDIYIRGLELEKFEESNQITDELLREKKRYSLLKTELWLNTLLLKKKCNAEFDTVAYLYSGQPTSSAIVSEQKIISNILRDLKAEKGNDMILLPIAGDLGLNIVEFQKNVRGVDSLPALVINEETVLEGFHSMDEIESYLNN